MTHSRSPWRAWAPALSAFLLSVPLAMGADEAHAAPWAADPAAAPGGHADPPTALGERANAPAAPAERADTLPAPAEGATARPRTPAASDVAETRNARIGVRLLPQMGIYSPLSHLGDVWEEGRPVLSAGRRSGNVLVGLGVELGSSNGGSGVRGNVTYAAPSEVPVSGPECQGCTARSSLLTATVATVYRPLSTLDRVRPQFIVGGGMKRYSFDLHGLGDGNGRALFRDQTRLAVEVGMGADVSISGVSIQSEVTGFVSRFRTEEEEGVQVDDAPVQTDFFLTLAIPLDF